jgi:hypothetical protein
LLRSHEIPSCPAFYGNAARDAGCFHSRESFDMGKQLLEELHLTARVVILRTYKGYFHGQEILRIESNFHAAELRERPDHEASANQERKCKSKFTGNQEVSQLATFGTLAGAPTAFIESRDDVGIR